LLGGAILGTAGGVFGAFMPFVHPVAITISVIWWCIYFGGFGACLGAWFCHLTERSPAPSSPKRKVANKLPSTFRPRVSKYRTFETFVGGAGI
jgi:hypothetical protein